MRIGIQTWGTEGDVRPFFALAMALMARGHEVKLVYTNVEGRTFEALAAGCGVDARSVGHAYFQENGATLVPAMEALLRKSNPLGQIRGIIEKHMDPVADLMFEASLELAAWSDGVVGHFLMHGAGTGARKHEKPYVIVSLAPVQPSAHYAPVGAPDLGRLGNGLLWKGVGWLLESIFVARVNRLRGKVGLPPIEGLMARTLELSVLYLTAVSPTLFARPPDWDPHVQLSGFLSIDEAAEPWEPEPALRAFLEAGPPPVFLSFGSMMSLGGAKTAETVQALAGAVTLAKTRGIIQAPEEARGGLVTDGSVCFITRAPHRQLFPRCSTIVHHGGAGTTQSALLAGRPSVVVPHVADQFFWGQTLEARGLGGKPLPRTKLTAPRLAERLQAVLGNAGMAARAAAAGDLLQREDGPGRAAELATRAFAEHGKP